MALGAVTKVLDTNVGNRKIRVRDVVPTSGANYTAGGETLDPSQVGLRVIEAAFTDAGARNASGNVLPVSYNTQSKKLQVYRYDGAAAGKASLEEAAAGFNASGFTVRITFIGY
jgi:hypothetical protein